MMRLAILSTTSLFVLFQCGGGVLASPLLQDQEHSSSAVGAYQNIIASMSMATMGPLDEGQEDNPIEWIMELVHEILGGTLCLTPTYASLPLPGFEKVDFDHAATAVANIASSFREDGGILIPIMPTNPSMEGIEFRAMRVQANEGGDCQGSSVGLAIRSGDPFARMSSDGTIAIHGLDAWLEWIA